MKKAFIRVIAMALVAMSSVLGHSSRAQGYYETDSTSVEIIVINGDTILAVHMPTLIVPGYRNRPLTPQQQNAMWRLIRDVKKTLPIAKDLAAQLIETYEYMETLPNDKARNRHMKAIEKELMRRYEPVMKSLTLRQGKLLIKLISRQTGSSGYFLVKSFFGSWKAGWWNLFANMYDASLKVDYDPKSVSEDALIERVVKLIEAGSL